MVSLMNNRITLSPPHTQREHCVRVPGSKSYTNRALLMAALADGKSTLRYASESTDSEALVRALSLLGVPITAHRDSTSSDATTLVVSGTGGRLTPHHGTIDVGPAGTTMRFLTALCATIPGAAVTLCGSARMHARPIADLVSALTQLGAQIEYTATPGCPPLQIASTHHLHGGDVQLNGTVSSQFLSALLLVSPRISGELRITIQGEQISQSYLDMTLQGMREFGVQVENTLYQQYVCPAGQRYQAQEYTVEGDASGASYLWGIAAISGSTITVENVNPLSAQGDIKFPSLLEQMGCQVRHTARSITVAGAPKLSAIEADMTSMPDTAQTLAVVAACASGRSVIRGLRTLRIKETDRIDALHTELAKMGIKSEAGPDYLVVHGGEPRAATIATYDDHRMAMSFAMLGARIAGVTIEEPHVVEKSFPTFWQVCRSLDIAVTPA